MRKRVLQAVLVISSTISSTLILSAAVPVPNEYWVSPNNPGGTGTLLNPYHAPTEVEFDAFMAARSANQVIHLLPGNFSTKGLYKNTPGQPLTGWSMRSGQRILGSGVDVTTLRLVGVPDQTSDTANAYAVAISSESPASDCEVADLTIDGNWNNVNRTNNQANCLNAVMLHGTRNWIRRVKAINMGSNIQKEPFVLHVGAFGSSFSRHNGIEECEISSYIGYFVTGSHGNTAYTVNSEGWDPPAGIMRYNTAYLPAVSAAAFNHAATKGLTIKGNYVRGPGPTSTGAAGTYGDTGSFSEGRILNNFYRGVGLGVYLISGGANTFSHYWVANNQIDDCFTSISFYGTQSATSVFDLLMENNNMINSVQVNSSYSALTENNIAGLTLTENRMSRVLFNNLGEFRTAPNGSPNLRLLNNVDEFGVPDYTYTPNPDVGTFKTPQTEFPNSLTRRSVSSNTTLTYSDHYLGVSGAGGAVSVGLPSAVGHAGKEFIICDETGIAGSFNIAVTPTGGQSLNGSTLGQSITSNHGSLTVVSDGAAWFVARRM